MTFRRILRAQIYTLLFAVCVFSAAGDGAGILRDFAEYTLQNGMQVFVLEDFAAAPIRIEYAVKAGTREQTPKTAGFFPLYTRLFAEAGKASYPEQIDDWLPSSAKISCGTDAARCVVTIAPEEIEKALSELAYCAFSPSFSDANIAAQFTALKSEVMNYSLSTAGFINASIDARIYAAAPWKRDSGVYPALFTKTPLAGVRSILMHIARSYYMPQNSALFISGGIRKEAALKAAEKTFGAWPAGAALPAQTKTASETASRKTQKRKFVISDPLFSSDLTQIVVQYTSLSAVQADMAAEAFNSRSSSFKSVVLSRKELGIRSSDYVDAASTHKNGEVRLVFQSLLEKSKTAPDKQVAAFIACVKDAPRSLSSAELMRAQQNLAAEYRMRFGNAASLMDALSEQWTSDRTGQRTEPLVSQIFGVYEDIINFDAAAFEADYTREEPFVFVLVNSSVYKRCAKAFAQAGYESVTQKNGSWYTQELYKNITSENLAEKKAPAFSDDVSDTAFYRAKNRAAFSSFTLANGIPVVCKQNASSPSALVMLSVSGGELGSASNPGFFSILVYALADNIQKEIDAQKELGTIDGTPSVRAEIDLTSGTISIESFADDMSVIMPCISRALIYGDIRPAQADGLVYNARSQKRLRDGNTANQLYSRAVAELFPSTPYAAVFDSNNDILEHTQYADVLASYPSLLDASRYTIIVTGRFDPLIIRDALASSLGMLAPQTLREKTKPAVGTPVFPSDGKGKRISVALRHLFFTDTPAKNAGPRPETLVPTKDFSDPVQYWLPSPTDTKERTIFNALLFALRNRLRKNAASLSADIAVHTDGATYAMQAAVITFTHAGRTAVIDKRYAETIAAFGAEIEDEAAFARIKAEIQNGWVLEKLSPTQTNRGTALLMHEGLEAAESGDALADAQTYLASYEIVDELSREETDRVFKTYFSAIAPLRLYSKDSKR